MKRRKNLFIPSSRIFVGQENVPLFVIASAFMARGNPFSFLFIYALPGLRIAASLRSSR